MTNWPWTDLRLHLLNDIIKSKNNSLIITEHWKKTPADFISLKYQRTRKVGKVLKFSHATPTFFPRSPYDVKYSNNSKQLKSYLSGLAARAIYFFLTQNGHFPRPAETDPYMFPGWFKCLCTTEFWSHCKTTALSAHGNFISENKIKIQTQISFRRQIKMWNILHFKRFSGNSGPPKG